MRSGVGYGLVLVAFAVSARGGLSRLLAAHCAGHSVDAVYAGSADPRIVSVSAAVQSFWFRRPRRCYLAKRRPPKPSQNSTPACPGCEAPSGVTAVANEKAQIEQAILVLPAQIGRRLDRPIL